MNRVDLMGRLIKNPDLRYTNANPPTAVARYILAVERKNKRDSDVTADFITCVTFGKSAEFLSKYVVKGQRIAVSGRIQTRTWTDKNGEKKYITEIVTEEHYFADANRKPPKVTEPTDDDENFIPVDDSDDEDLPF